MRKTLAAIFAFLMICSLGTFAQDQSATGSSDKKVAKAEKKEAKAAAKHKAMSLTGWVKSEGDKVMFVNDKDKQSWSVSNPDVLKPHDGKHVSVKATLDEADKSITVEKVKELRKGKQSAETQKQPY
ncbi:MAG TPA: hypothetical protein VFM10_05370 [Terriglobales bacterium]|jgi:hypothetical protein|nr:hypothetical protein [Terriglobales bacterium]